ncbi:MAG: hypothetical protein MOB07_12240, partial [Acidobacteria bacterium]|nr:hypothetical protein [Acidobacteriota bacterium]
MRASYKNTSVALLVTFALSLFFVYAMRPNEVVGSGANPPSAEWKNPSSVEVALETLEEVGPGNVVADDDNDFKITLSSATTNAIRTSVIGSLESEKNTQHRIEFYTSPVCGSKGLENPRFLGAVTVKTNDDGQFRFTANISPPLTAGHFVAVKAINQKENKSVFSNCLRIIIPTPTPTPKPTVTPTPTPTPTPRPTPTPSPTPTP